MGTPSRVADQISEILGVVKNGSGLASLHLPHVHSVIEERVGLPALRLGSLNLELRDHYAFTAVTAVVTDREFNRHQQCIKLRRCRVRKAGTQGFGLKGVLIRPSQHERPGRPHLWMRLEIMSHHHLRTALGVDNGDEVIAEVEDEDCVDEAWWAAEENITD